MLLLFIVGDVGVVDDSDDVKICTCLLYASHINIHTHTYIDDVEIFKKNKIVEKKFVVLQKIKKK